MNDQQKKLEEAKMHALACVMAAVDGSDACSWAQTYSTLCNADTWMTTRPEVCQAVAMEDVP